MQVTRGLIAHTVVGAIGVVQQTIDRAGLVVIGLLTVWLLIVMTRRVRTRAGSAQVV